MRSVWIGLDVCTSGQRDLDGIDLSGPSNSDDGKINICSFDGSFGLSQCSERQSLRLGRGRLKGDQVKISCNCFEFS